MKGANSAIPLRIGRPRRDRSKTAHRL